VVEDEHMIAMDIQNKLKSLGYFAEKCPLAMMTMSDNMAGNDWNANAWKENQYQSLKSIPPHL
jgi:hypothetical protein